MTTRLMIVGGFLGAGKTTLLLKSARLLTERGYRVGLVTNDQGKDLVDTLLLSQQSFPVTEVSGSCFCCAFPDLLQALHHLQNTVQPDVILAEPVGSCTDLVATVLRPLTEYYPGHFEVAPLTVLVDATRELDLFSNNVSYLFDRQLAESELILLNKTDLVESSQLAQTQAAFQSKYSQARLFSISAHIGTGIDQWLDIVLGRTSSSPICSNLRKELVFGLTKTNKEKLFQMTTITELCPVIQVLLIETANRLAKETGFIQRKRQVTGASFAQSAVLGWLNQPDATRRQLHHAAIKSGMEISLQGLDKRFTAKAVEFMRQLVIEALKEVLRSETPKPVFSQFKGVYLTDCSQTMVGNGGEKLAVRLELQQGQLQVSLEEVCTNDQRTSVVGQLMPEGALHIADLGFFKLKRFQAWNEEGIYWLTRFKVGTWLYDENGQALDLLACLNEHPTDTFYLPVRVGKRDRVAACLVAQRVSEAVLENRQAQFKELRRRQHPVSATKIALAQWTIYLTSIPDLTFEQAHILARSRWQIELVFKLWKSHAHLTRSRSGDPLRQRCEFYAKLLAVLISHWILLVTGWQHLTLSPVQALSVIRNYAFAFLKALSLACPLESILIDIQSDLWHVGHHASRLKAPLAFQLWRDFGLIPA